MKISMITVGMNHKNYIGTLYGSLYSQIKEGMEVEVIYVDNCSTDGSISYLRKNYPQVMILQNTEPLGFGENNNKGMMASKGDYIGIVNPDIVFTEGSLDNIVKMFKTNWGG